MARELELSGEERGHLVVCRSPHDGAFSLSRRSDHAIGVEAVIVTPAGDDRAVTVIKGMPEQAMGSNEVGITWCDADIKTKPAHEQQRFDNFGPGLKLLDAFASALRAKIAACEIVDASSVTAEVVEEADKIIAQASGHADGSKILLKRVRAILA